MTARSVGRMNRSAAVGMAVAVLSLVACQAGGDAPSGGDSATAEVSGPAPTERCDELAGLLEGSGSASGTTCRVTFPRENLSVELLGARLPTSMSLTSWAAFGPAPGDSAIVMGDLALTSSELPRVMAGLRANGLRVTAVHRHMVGESPPMSFMHYLGVGPAEDLARSLRAALDRALREAGIDVVALHNHMLQEEPRIKYFHFQERGAPMEVARGLRSGLAAAGLVRTR